jgi:TonB family protein
VTDARRHRIRRHAALRTAALALVFLAGCASSVTPVASYPANVGACTGPITKARVLSIGSAAGYTTEARRHAIEGRVRVAFTIDETGVASNLRVVQGLGYGLDEAALASVRTMEFSPATSCGVPVSSQFTASIRFVLGSPPHRPEPWWAQ